MKKVFLLLFLTFFLTGCMNVNKSSYEDIINYSLKNNKLALKNHTSKGYSYYLPKKFNIIEDHGSNVILKNANTNLYLYLDLISYYNKIVEDYTINKQAFYSQKIKNGDKYGYLEINLKENDKYLIEIMYNYAKIEVIVDKNNIKNMLSYSIALLTSITYNDVMIENMIGEDVLNYNEIEFNIFDTVRKENSSIENNENTSNSELTDDIPDTDLIN